MSNRIKRHRGRVTVPTGRSGVEVTRENGNVLVTMSEGRCAWTIRWTLAECRAVINLLTSSIEEPEKTEEFTVASGLVVTDRMPGAPRIQ